MSDTKTKEPLSELLSVTEAASGYKVWVRALAIVLALVVDAIFIYSCNRPESIIRIWCYV